MGLFGLFDMSVLCLALDVRLTAECRMKAMVIMIERSCSPASTSAVTQPDTRPFDTDFEGVSLQKSLHPSSDLAAPQRSEGFVAKDLVPQIGPFRTISREGGSHRFHGRHAFAPRFGA